MNFVTIAILIEFAVYLFYIGVIASISDSFRTVNDKRIYRVFFAAISITVMLQELYAPDHIDLWYLFAGFCLWGLSLAAEFWKKDQGFWHVAFTYTAIVILQTLTVVWIWPAFGVLSILPAIVLLAGAWILRTVLRWNVTYWQEVLALLTICGPIVYIKYIAA
jgi:hypothetical protein